MYTHTIYIQHSLFAAFS